MGFWDNMRNYIYGSAKKESDDGKKSSKDNNTVIETVTDEEANVRLSKERLYMNMIIKSLKAINWEEVRKKNKETDLPDTEFASMKKRVEALLKKISLENSAKLVELNVEIIDRELWYFAEHLEKTLLAGNIRTAQSYINGLGYGIAQCHEDILLTDKDNADEIIDLRIAKIDALKEICKLNEEADKCTHAISKLKNKRKKCAKEYNFQKAYLKEDKIKRPHIYDEIDRMSINSTVPISSDARDAAALLRNLKSLKTNYRTFDDLIVRYQETQNSILNTIQTLDVNAVTADVKIDMTFTQQLRVAFNKIANNMNQMDNAVVENDKAYDAIIAELDAINRNPDIIKSIISAKNDVDIIIQKDEEEERKREEGQKRFEDYQEQERKKKEEQMQAKAKKIKEMEERIKQQEANLNKEEEDENEEEDYNPNDVIPNE